MPPALQRQDSARRNNGRRSGCNVEQRSTANFSMVNNRARQSREGSAEIQLCMGQLTALRRNLHSPAADGYIIGMTAVRNSLEPPGQNSRVVGGTRGPDCQGSTITDGQKTIFPFVRNSTTAHNGYRIE